MRSTLIKSPLAAVSLGLSFTLELQQKLLMPWQPKEV